MGSADAAFGSAAGLTRLCRLKQSAACIQYPFLCILAFVSRRRRPFLSDRFFFLTVKLLPWRPALDETDFALRARSSPAVRGRQRFLLTAWVFLPDHWHAILRPAYPLTISQRVATVGVLPTVGSLVVGGKPPVRGALTLMATPFGPSSSVACH